MNGDEQKNHRVVTQELGRTLATVAETTASQLSVLRSSINNERTHRIALADEQRAYVDARDKELRVCCQERWDSVSVTTKRLADRHGEFVARGFWSRLNWLLTGR